MSSQVKFVSAKDVQDINTLQTSGMARKEVFAGEGAWMGLVESEPGKSSGWHHHGDYDTYIYILSGEVRVEYGPGGKKSAKGGAGDFAFVPRQTIHRETTEGSATGNVVLIRVGNGVPVVNVDGPE